MTPGIYKKVQSSLKKFKDAYIRDTNFEDLIEKLIESLAPDAG